MNRLCRLSVAIALLLAVGACVDGPGYENESVITLPVTSSSEEAKSRIVEGLKAQDAGRFVDAGKHFKAAVAADPDCAFAHFGAAFSANSLEQFSKHLKLAVENAPNASEAEQLLIASAQKGFDNDLEGQLADAKRLVEIAPDSPRAWLWLGSSHDALGQSAEARAAAKKAAEISPRFVAAYTQLGNSYLFSDPRDIGMAETAMVKVAELQPDEQQSHDLLGDVYRAQGKLEDARAAYTRAAELAPDNGSPLQQRGHVNSFLGNYDDARADYQASMDLSEDDVAATYAVWKALVSVHAGDSAGAIRELNELATAVDGMDIEEPRDYKLAALFNAGQIATHHGMAKAAKSAIEQCRVLMMEQADEVGTDQFRRGQEAQLAYSEGMLAARTGDYAGAKAGAQRIMDLLEPDSNPRKNEPAHEILGLAALLQGDYQTSIEHYEQTDPADVYARYHLGLAHEAAGHTDQAREIFNEVAGYNFNFAGYALIRAEVLDKASS